MAEALDHKVLGELKQMADLTGDPNFLVDLVQTFFRTSDEGLAKIAQLVAERSSTDAVRKAAHALKSSCGNLGAREMHATCAELEALAAAGGDFDRLGSLVRRLGDENARARHALAQAVPGSGI